MINNINNLDDLLAKIQDKTFTVSYFDKYNQSEFSMRLMLQFIDQLKSICSIEISELKVNLVKEVFKSHDYPRFIIHNYRDIEAFGIRGVSKLMEMKK